MAHLFKRRGTMPAESIVYRDWKNGVSRAQMAARYGVTEGGIGEYLRRRVERWRNQPPAQIANNARKIVRTAIAVSESGYREIQISLPRITMHVKAMEARA
ncbi:hypothetical protein U8C32_16945 [Sinorhizobium medicae]|uniref:hypothetical protein n=1 Tax=Sinorhizobium medicae TaxID=110321 RepID=UPI00299EBF94|nr:hypothetical protein [Sinorhizobium medicae]MDW9398659.1 hypothetical protein [Sinorhizobium meliloti]WQO44865.1 hypothetical protein U8C42_17020 [Sinorhizobium medicae]WQO72107.1 hypothetical protein U8C31_17880 [Sinorhizobium medicae]WQO91452.1 hypothetical protein U8C32_16945 [Sinorhizobium medicae]